MALKEGMQVEARCNEEGYRGLLKEGMQVEARCNEEGYRGAWVEGIVSSFEREACSIKLKKFAKGNGKSLVEETSTMDYENSLVKVSLGDVRPIPPHRQLPLHCLDGAAVEAKEIDCWWQGFIVKQVQCDGQKLWLVFFPHTKFLTAYPLPHLRPAQEWRGGKWTIVPPEKTLNIGQVIRVQSDPETLNSKNHCDLCDLCCKGCPTEKKIQDVNTEEPSSRGYKSKAIPVSRGSQTSFEELKSIEQNQQGRA